MSQEQKEQPFFPPRPGRGFGHGGARVPVSKPKNFSATIKRLWQAFGREKRWLPLVFAIVLVDGLLMLSAPYLIGKAIDAMTGGAE
ncbi:multidrug ABC transporter ATP-binding protein, partial [Brevibacillus agri]